MVSQRPQRGKGFFVSELSEGRPRTATWVGAILLVEALGMLAVAVWLAIAALGDPLEHIAGGLFLAVLAAGSAAFLMAAGRAMLDGRAWSRSATIVWQVLQLGVALGTYDGGEGPVPLALVLAALSIAGLALVLRASVTGWLRREP
ncbi:thiol:disulfide interchange protein [Agrococcus sp. UYP33]